MLRHGGAVTVSAGGLSRSFTPATDREWFIDAARHGAEAVSAATIVEVLSGAYITVSLADGRELARQVPEGNTELLPCLTPWARPRRLAEPGSRGATTAVMLPNQGVGRILQGVSAVLLTGTRFRPRSGAGTEEPSTDWGPATPSGRWSPRPATSHSALGQIRLGRAEWSNAPGCADQAGAGRRTDIFRGLQQAGDPRRRQSSIQSGLISGSYEISVQH